MADFKTYKQKQHNFVYVTTNLINGKQYDGDHSTDNLDDSYLGSGRHLKQSIKKYGIKSFKREIIECFPTREESFNAQTKYIKEYKTHISLGGYNLDWTGGLGVPLETWGGHTNETKLKISNYQKGKVRSIETKNKISDANTGKVRSIEAREKYRIAKIGTKLSIEHKLNIGLSGKNRIFSEEHKINLSKSKAGENNPNFGKIPWNKGMKKQKLTI